MAPLALSFGLFAFWLVLGWAVLSIARITRDCLRDLLLAPPVGLAVTIVPTFIANYVFGLPVVRFGPLLAEGIGLMALVGLVWARPARPPRQYLAFVVLFILALVTLGRPMLEFGFDWLSFANDDMANYVLGAQFFLSHTYANVPDPATLVSGVDYSQFYWYFYVPHAVRAGSELLLAWVMSVTGLIGPAPFMPLILALYLVLISATAALVCQTRELWLAALVAAVLLAASALSTFGLLAQLIAQVGGLALMAAAASLLMSPDCSGLSRVKFRAGAWSLALRSGAVLGLVGAALVLVYPEIVAFLVLGFGLAAGVQVIRRRLDVRSVLARGATSVGVSLVLLNSYIGYVAIFTANQVENGLRPSGEAAFTFPYFLLPSGLADFWGLQTIFGVGTDPWLSISIAIGALALVGAAAIAIALTWRGNGCAAIAIGMLVFGVRLFSQQADFGLFKLAMFVQPFLLGSLAIACVGVMRRHRWAAIVPVAVVAAGAYGQMQYVNLSAGGYSEIPNGSQSHLTREFQDLVTGLPASHVALDTTNLPLAKLQAAYMRGLDATFPSRDFFSEIIGFDLGRAASLGEILPGTLPVATEARDAVDSRIVPEFFQLQAAENPAATDEFLAISLGDPPSTSDGCDLFVSTGQSQSVFNRRQVDGTNLGDFTASPCGEVSNHLIFIHSQLGENYYQVAKDFGQDVSPIGIFAMEPDALLPGRTMAGIGRYLLFQVMNPSSPVRIALDVTATLKGDGSNSLPPAALIGQSRAAFPLEGRGSARVYSPPIQPQVIGGRSYVALDMGVDGQRFPNHKQGLMNLYNGSIPLDRRELVAFARDISLVSDQEFAQLSPPSVLQHFPGDLLNPDLQYSGAYEDGWISESSFFDLQQTDGASTLSMQGTVPLISDPAFRATLQVLIDGTPVLTQDTAPGDFDIHLPSPVGAGRHRVELQFSRFQSLPGGDGRPVGALLRSIGFVTSPGSPG